MAFDSTKLRMTSDGQYPGERNFKYLSSDDVTGAGYFPTTTSLKQGDLVKKVDHTLVAGEITATATTEYVISVAVADGELTAIATT
jgi:hypothetical protein